jgi:hypothetical protein
MDWNWVMIDSGKRKVCKHNRGLCWMAKTHAKGFAPRLIYP